MPVTHFIWDRVSDNVLSEVDEAGVETARYMNEPDQFGNLLSQRRNGTNSFYHFGDQGSTRQLTNDTETVTDSYTYTAFGETVASSGSTGNPFRYNGAWGYYTDSETDEIYVRNRTYQSDLGRWLSQDPILFFDGVNLYLYVQNEPVSSFDPFGYLTLTTDDVTPNIGCICHCICTDYTRSPSRRFGYQIPMPPGITKRVAEIECGNRCSKRGRPTLEGKRIVCSFDHVSNCDTNTTLIDHGNYCGPFRRVAKCCDRLPVFPLDPPAIDSVDLACAYHDCCVGTKDLWWDFDHHRRCNAAFCFRLRFSDCEDSPDKRSCRTYRNRAWLLTCGTLFFPVPIP